MRKEGGEGIIPWTSCGFQRGDLVFDPRVEQPVNPSVFPPPPSKRNFASRSVFCKGNVDTPLRAFPPYSLFKPLPQLTDNGPNCGLFTSESGEIHREVQKKIFPYPSLDSKKLQSGTSSPSGNVDVCV